jgi:hypothetical protein
VAPPESRLFYYSSFCVSFQPYLSRINGPAYYSSNVQLHTDFSSIHVEDF